MKVAILALIFACYHLAEGAHWALLIAGSKGYGNYRHQADVCHSYQLLRKHGIPADNIVTMMYDDIANNYRNPYKGNIINQPNGPNVYQGIRIDYRGSDVTPTNFLNVLSGVSTGAGNGRVIKSGANDHVFVYYSDHGNRQLVGFPHGVLYARDLNARLQSMHSRNQYKKLVFYLEACYSGTMFDQHLPSNHNIWAITAANTRESSYSCYYDSRRRTYLADEFSARWMQDSEQSDFSTHTLAQQFSNVKRNVHNSHVMVYGDVSGMGSMKIGQFQGDVNMAPRKQGFPPITDAVPSYDVPYMSLMHQLQDANTTEARLEVLHEMQLEQKAQFEIRETMEGIVQRLTPNPALMMQVKETKASAEQYHCYELAVEKYLQTCTGFNEYEYAMKDLHVFANLCNEGRPIESISEAIERVCKA